MHIASFAGFAPVNNPVISIAIVIDSPHGDYYGTAVSAPVFAEVAQQVLEYLGVPHDIELKPSTTSDKNEAPAEEDDASSDSGDMNTLYSAVNDLPNDDPLRNQPPPPTPAGTSALAAQSAHAPNSTPSNAKPGSPPATSASSPSLSTTTTSSPPPSNSVVIADGATMRVPSLIGLTVRQVIEQAGSAGLEVDIVGNGTAREQVPAPGSMVRPGTKIVVRCAR